MNRKLDNLVGQAGVDKSPSGSHKFPPRLPPRIIGLKTAQADKLTSHHQEIAAAVDKVMVHHQEPVHRRGATGAPPVSPPVEDRKAKFKRIRRKIRAIGAMIAAGKRRNRQNSFTEPHVKTPRTEDGDLTPPPSRGISRISRQSKSAIGARIISSFWHSDTGDRRQQIQQALHSQRTRKGCRYKLWQFFESPYSSKAALMYSWLLKVLLVSSVVLAFVDSSYERAGLDITQVIFELLFAVEFVLRFLCCPHCCDFVLSAFNLLDLLSVLPLILRLAPSSIGLLSRNEHVILSLVPFLRLLKLMRQFEKLQLLLHAFELALEALPSLLYLAAVLLIFFAEMLYLVEPSDSDINTLPTAIWFSLVTMTTVGYGDYSPKTTAGHMVASALIISSMLYMAVPLGIVGNAFSEVWGDRDRLLVMKRFRNAFLEGGFTVQAFQDIFSIFDADGNGSLDIEEFSLMLKSMQMNISEDRVQLLYQALDHHGAGCITLEALVDGLAPKAFARHQVLDFVRSRSLMPSRILASWSMGTGSKPMETLVDQSKPMESLKESV